MSGVPAWLNLLENAAPAQGLIVDKFIQLIELAVGETFALCQSLQNGTLPEPQPISKDLLSCSIPVSLPKISAAHGATWSVLAIEKITQL